MGQDPEIVEPGSRTTPRPWSRDGISEALLAIILTLALPLVLASGRNVFADGDVSWHVASGRWIFAHHSIPRADPFSFTAAGHPWVAMEWLGDVSYAVAYNIAGYAGLAAVVGAALIALHLLIVAHLVRRVGPIGIAVALMASDAVLNTFILARPHVLVWPLLAAWTILLLDAAEEERTPPLWAALILALWTNIHASFPIAALIGAAIAFDALRKTNWKNWRDWGWFALASLFGVMLNANGLRGVTYPFHIAGLAMLPLIQEWQPTRISMTPQFYVALGGGLFVLLYNGVRVPLGRLLLLLTLGALAFAQVRHQSWFVIVACCVVPPLVGSSKSRTSALRWLPLAAIPLLATRALWPITPIDNAANPRGLIAAVPANLRTQAVFNGYSFGGPLILAGIRPYIDGRADMYGDAFVLDYSRIMEGDLPRFEATVKQYGIRWTMLPAGSILAQELDRSPAWKRVYADRIGVIHTRRS